MSRIQDNITRLREESGMSQEQLGQKIGKTRSAISQYESGKIVPRMGVIEDLAAVFDVPKSEIIGETISGWIEVPLYGSIAAGTPIEMDAADGTHEIPAKVHERYPDAFLLKVEGDSMNRIIPNGSYALVNPCKEVIHNGKPHAVCVNGYDATIKRVNQLNNGFELVPDSTDPTYTKEVYNYNDPKDEKITIIGEVVYYVLPFDWGF